MVNQTQQRPVKVSTTCFLQCEDQYLFVHRTKKGNDTDAGKLNGIGGKLEPGENFLQCAIRETEEETGYQVTEADCRLVGVVNMHGGYNDDWLMCFFVIGVPTRDIPIGTENDEGELMWLNFDAVLNTEYRLVDDLQYCWTDICNKKLFFANAQVDEAEKISQWSVSYLK